MIYVFPNKAIIPAVVAKFGAYADGLNHARKTDWNRHQRTLMLFSGAFLMLCIGAINHHTLQNKIVSILGAVVSWTFAAQIVLADLILLSGVIVLLVRCIRQSRLRFFPADWRVTTLGQSASFAAISLLILANGQNTPGFILIGFHMALLLLISLGEIAGAIAKITHRA